MGLILDSSVVIAGERRGHTVWQILEQVHSAYHETEVVVTVVELMHGVYRAKLDTARLAGRIEGEQAEHGVSIAFEDLLIAATALQLGFGIATANVRHFQLIPGLRVVAQA